MERENVTYSYKEGMEFKKGFCGYTPIQRNVTADNNFIQPSTIVYCQIQYIPKKLNQSIHLVNTVFFDQFAIVPFKKGNFCRVFSR